MGNHATSSDAGLQPPIRLPPCRRPAEAKARPAVCDTSGQPLRPSCFATHLTSGQGTRRPSTSSPLAGNLEQILCAPWSRPRQGLARPARKRPRYTQIQRCKIPRQPLHVHVPSAVVAECGRRASSREGCLRVQTHGWGGAVKWGDQGWEIQRISAVGYG